MTKENSGIYNYKLQSLGRAGWTYPKPAKTEKPEMIVVMAQYFRNQPHISPCLSHTRHSEGGAAGLRQGYSAVVIVTTEPGVRWEYLSGDSLFQSIQTMVDR